MIYETFFYGYLFTECTSLFMKSLPNVCCRAFISIHGSLAPLKKVIVGHAYDTWPAVIITQQKHDAQKCCSSFDKCAAFSLFLPGGWLMLGVNSMHNAFSHILQEDELSRWPNTPSKLLFHSIRASSSSTVLNIHTHTCCSQEEEDRPTPNIHTHTHIQKILRH